MKNPILVWNDLALEAVRIAKPGPPMVARTLGLLYTAAYDAWAAYDAVAKPVRSTVPRRPPVQRTDPNRMLAIHTAAYRMMLDQFPTLASLDAALAQKLADTLTAAGGDPTNTSLNPGTPIGVGNAAAKANIDFAHADGANQLGDNPSGTLGEPYSDTTGYAPKNPAMIAALPAAVDAIPDPGHWQPLTYLDGATPATPKFIGAHWRNVTPFALTSASQFLPPPPQAVASQGFLDQAKHVIEVQAKLDPKQMVIAEYWADGPKSELPPGHWTLFAAFVAKRDNMTLEQTVKMYFAMSNAIGDAAIATWDAKVQYDYVRPITAIRHLFRGKRITAWGGPGKGTVEMQGEAWRTFQKTTFPTPPFAEYTSGHSAFSMAAAEVLKQFTGSAKFGSFYARQTPLDADPSVPVGDVVLHWETFEQAAREAGESRLYGGIHFYEGNVAGLELGRKVGQQAFAKAKNFWDGI
ncbi:MAG: vanadium-dependent haloperoxidase [Bryobacteraceae bacterium]